MNIFRHFTVKKASFSQPAEKLSYLYFGWVAYMNAICKECLLKKTCIRDEMSWIMREKKGFGNRLLANFVRGKNTFFPSVTLKCRCLPGILGKFTN